MLDDLTKEIKAQLYERVKSPLLGAFSLSWVAWNYRALLAVLSNMTFQETLTYLETVYPTAWYWAGYCFAGPLLTAVAFLLVYPHPARWAYSYWAKQQKELKKVQQKIEDETPLTQEEANALRKTGLAQVKEFQTQLKELVALNKELEERLKLLQEENIRLTIERDQFGKAAKKAQVEAELPLATVVNQVPKIIIDEVGEFPSKIGRNHEKVFQENLTNVQKISLVRKLGERPEAHKALLALISLDGEGVMEDVVARTGMGKIDTRHGLDYLKDRNIADLRSGKWYLTAEGRALAVDLDLTKVILAKTAPNTVTA